MTRPTGRKAKQRRELPKYPRSIRQRVDAAMVAVERLFGTLTRHGFLREFAGPMEVLRAYRLNRPYGILNPHFLREEIPDDDFRVLMIDRLDELDRAFAELHGYQPDEHLSAGVQSALSRFHRTGGVTDDTPEAERLLLRMGILHAPRGPADTPETQGWIRKRVADLTSLSPRTVDGIASRLRRQEQSELQKGIAISEPNSNGEPSTKRNSPWPVTSFPSKKRRAPR